MPNISEFSAGSLAIRPTETGVEAFAAAGRRLGAAFNQEGQAIEGAGARIGRGIRDAGDAAVAYMDHQQINAGADHGATLFATLTDSWNQTSAGADPHDPSVAKKWRTEQLEPALQQFTEGFTTEKSQDWANHFVNTQREHFFAKTEADMSSLAKDSVTTTVTNLSTKLSNAAVNDPSSVDASIDFVKHSIDGILAVNPNIKGTDAARVKLEVSDKVTRDIVHAGALGAIMKSSDPEATATAWATKYPDYVNGAEAVQFAKAARTQERTNTLLAKQTEIADRQLAQHNVETARNKIWADNVTFDPTTNQFNIKPDFFQQAQNLPLKYPKAPNATETARTLIDWGEVKQRELTEARKIVSNPAAVSDLDSRMFATDNATTTIQVLRAEADGKLSAQDATLRRELITARDEGPLKDPVVKAALQAAKDRFTYAQGNTAEDPFGSASYARFMESFLRDYTRAASTPGGAPSNALDMRDPNSLISKAIASSRQLLQSVITPPIADTIAPAPTRPKNYPKDAQWDANRKIWYIMQDGKKFRIDPAAQPEMPQVPMR